MKFHKGKFNLRLDPSTVKEGTTEIPLVEGWIDETKRFGFDKREKGSVYWTATDIYTGKSICHFSTRKECVNWIEKNMERIENEWKKESYLIAVKELEELIKKEK